MFILMLYYAYKTINLRCLLKLGDVKITTICHQGLSMKPGKDRILKKHSLFVFHKNTTFTPFQQAVFDLIIYIAQKTNKSLSDKIMISFPELKKALKEHNLAARSYNEMEEAICELAGVSFEFNEYNMSSSELKRVEESSGNDNANILFPDIDRDGDIVIVQTSNFFFDLIRLKNEETVNLLLDISLKAKKKHTIKLYQLIMRYANNEETIPCISIDTLNNIFGANYNYNNLRRYILEPSQKELARLGVEIKWDKLKDNSGKKVTHLKFNADRVKKVTTANKINSRDDELLRVPLANAHAETLEIVQQDLNKLFEDTKVKPLFSVQETESNLFFNVINSITGEIYIAENDSSLGINFEEIKAFHEWSKLPVNKQKNNEVPIVQWMKMIKSDLDTYLNSLPESTYNVSFRGMVDGMPPINPSHTPSIFSCPRSYMLF